MGTTLETQSTVPVDRTSGVAPHFAYGAVMVTALERGEIDIKGYAVLNWLLHRADNATLTVPATRSVGRKLLAELMRVDPKTITGITAKLERAGWLSVQRPTAADAINKRETNIYQLSAPEWARQLMIAQGKLPAGWRKGASVRRENLPSDAPESPFQTDLSEGKTSRHQRAEFPTPSALDSSKRDDDLAGEPKAAPTGSAVDRTTAARLQKLGATPDEQQLLLAAIDLEYSPRNMTAYVAKMDDVSLKARLATIRGTSSPRRRSSSRASAGHRNIPVEQRIADDEEFLRSFGKAPVLDDDGWLSAA